MNDRPQEIITSFTDAELLNMQMHDDFVRGKWKLPTREKRECVYLFRMGNAYKIGRTRDLEKRMSELDTPKLPYEIELVYVIYLNDFETGAAIEARLHQRFRDKRLRGEWFNLSPDDIDQLKAEF